MKPMTLPDLWTLLSAPAIDLLGWTLLHFVWQGTLVAALLAGVLRLLDDHPPRVRYVVSGAALLTLLVLPIATGVVLSEHVLIDERGDTIASVLPATVAAPSASSAPVPADADLNRSSSWYEAAASEVQPALPWIVVVWGFGVVAGAVRLAGGAWRVRRLRRTSTPAPSEWQERLRGLANRMRLSGPVALRQSARIESPMVVGWWRPVVLVPASVLTGLPPDQVEALLRHELAHIRRHDVLVGRLQAVVEGLLFFHPATWWISRQVRRTREACCDALAVRAGAGRSVYAKALAALAEQAVAGAPSGWTPAASDGSLLGRIQQVLLPSAPPSTHVQRLSMGAAILLLAGLPLGLAACASQQSVDGMESREREGAASAATAPADSTKETRERRIVIRNDSTARTLRLEDNGPFTIDSLGDGVVVFWRGGDRDTLDLPKLPDLPELEDLDIDIDVDSLDRALRARINTDSIERAVHARINADSLERVIRIRVNPDSLARVHALRADSLARWHRAHADSLRRHMDGLRRQMEREMPEQLREQARRLREQAERLEERAREMEVPTPPDEPMPPDTNGE
jgi:beta-lactamase regulating signal transducer with metallopeptidase domain